MAKRARRDFNASRFLSAEVMKSRSAVLAVLQIAKTGQDKNRPRKWFLDNISGHVLEKLVGRLMGAQAHRTDKEIVEDLGLPKRTIFTGDDIHKAASRLLRKVAILERCVGEAPGTPNRAPPYMP